MAKAIRDEDADFIDVCASRDVDVNLATMKRLIDLVQGATDTLIAVDSLGSGSVPNPLSSATSPR